MTGIEDAKFFRHPVARPAAAELFCFLQRGEVLPRPLRCFEGLENASDLVWDLWDCFGLCCFILRCFGLIYFD